MKLLNDSGDRAPYRENARVSERRFLLPAPAEATARYTTASSGVDAVPAIGTPDLPVSRPTALSDVVRVVCGFRLVRVFSD